MADERAAAMTGRWIGVLFLIWNFIGIGAFAMQWTMDLDALAKTDPYQAKTFAEMPAWAWGAYGVAVAAGTLGALCLVLRRRWAVILSGVEVIAVLVQFGYTFLGTDLMAQKGPAETVPLPAAIIAIAIMQFFYARWIAGKGVLR